MITASVKLCSEDPRAGYGSENTKIKYKNQLIGNGHTGHLLRSHLAYHDVVQKTHKVGDPVLYHDRNHNHKDHPVKVFVPNILFHVFLPSSDVSMIGIALAF